MLKAAEDSVPEGFADDNVPDPPPLCCSPQAELNDLKQANLQIMSIRDDPRYQPTISLMRIVKDECISDLEEDSDDGVPEYKLPTTEKKTITKDKEVSN